MNALAARIRGEIADNGPMPFDRYMQIALYDPEDGFFGSGRLRSARDGDFLTSPEVSPLFGAQIAHYVESTWERLGRPDRLAVCDAGAGSGSLLASLLAELPMAVDAYAVEVSPAARDTLSCRLPDVQLLESIDDLSEQLHAVIVANELLDNLPMALAVRTVDGWEERWVTAAETELEFVGVPPRPEVEAWLERWAGLVGEGGFVEVQMAATTWVARALGKLSVGGLVVFDYGDTAEGLAARRRHGTLRTYQGHHLGPEPLAQPGATDLTADVNFSALCDTAEAAGARAQIGRQADVLRAWGMGDLRDALRAEELTHARAGNTFPRLQTRTRLTEVDTLLHPRGLGDFRVLLAEK